MKKSCGNCANHKKETYQFSDECGKCVAAILENGEMTDPSHWKEKPKTNADRIRAMTDEELEQFINHFNICDIRTNDECKMSYCACCEVCVMDWLQQPCEEDCK